MRMIDADKFKEDLLKLWDYSSVDGITATTVLKQVISDLDNAPTVADHSVEIAQKSIELGRSVGRTEGAIESQRPQGKWIIVKDERRGDNVKCPFCGKELAGTDLNFCCKCGAKMKGGAE